MARDYIGLAGIDQEEALPSASDYGKALEIAKANSDIFDYSDGLQTIVDVDLDES